jgi:hypothetical protein
MMKTVALAAFAVICAGCATGAETTTTTTTSNDDRFYSYITKYETAHGYSTGYTSESQYVMEAKSICASLGGPLHGDLLGAAASLEGQGPNWSDPMAVEFVRAAVAVYCPQWQGS